MMMTGYATGGLCLIPGITSLSQTTSYWLFSCRGARRKQGV